MEKSEYKRLEKEFIAKVKKLRYNCEHRHTLQKIPSKWNNTSSDLIGICTRCGKMLSTISRIRAHYILKPNKKGKRRISIVPIHTTTKKIESKLVITEWKI